jgi:apolipoprotein N-acyltransferase
VLQPQLVVFAWVRHAAIVAGRRGANRAARALIAALAYVAAEWALPKLLGDTLGHGLQSSDWLRQGADVGGAPGLTVLIVLANEAALAACRAVQSAGRGQRLRASAAPLACMVAIVALLAGYGAFRLARLSSARPSLLRAALVQADISRYERLRQEFGTYDTVRMILDTHFALSEEALSRGPLDVVLWPETMYPTTFGKPRSEAGAELDAEIREFAEASGATLVFGAYDAVDGAEFNAAFVLAPGRPMVTYRKSALFPLTERVPAWLDSAMVRSLMPWLGTWHAGDGPRVVPLALPGGRTLRAGPLICYDAVEPRFAREAAVGGADLLVTLSNDSWFAAGAGPNLHLVVAAFRSLETRLPQLRVTNTGITAWIDATGAIRGRLGVHQRGVLMADVQAGPGGTTIAMRWGEWVGPVATATAVLLFVALRILRR